MNTADILNAITEQKNELLILVNKAEDAGDLEYVERQINFVHDLWRAVSYGYKITELRSAIRKKAYQLEIAEQEFLVGLRKNASCRGSTERNIQRLKFIVANCF